MAGPASTVSHRPSIVTGLVPRRGHSISHRVGPVACLALHNGQPPGGAMPDFARSDSRGPSITALQECFRRCNRPQARQAKAPYVNGWAR